MAEVTKIPMVNKTTYPHRLEEIRAGDTIKMLLENDIRLEGEVLSFEWSDNWNQHKIWIREPDGSEGFLLPESLEKAPSKHIIFWEVISKPYAEVWQPIK